MYLLDLPILFGVLIFVGGAIFLIFVPYVVLRALFSKRLGGDTETVAVNVLFRIGALHGLILALVFADVLIQFNSMRNNVAQEAAAVGDLLHNLENYGPEETAQITDSVHAYLNSVVYEEWPALSDQILQRQTWLQWQLFYLSILDLEPTSARDESLRERLIRDAEEIANSREQRLFTVAQGLSTPFWVIAIVGFFFVTIPFFVYKPKLANLFLLTIFGAYNGMIIYFILALSSPFMGPVSLEPTPFLILKNLMQSNVNSE
jgi:hypothetical protein